jgi:hypothetical protein
MEGGGGGAWGQRQLCLWVDVGKSSKRVTTRVSCGLAVRSVPPKGYIVTALVFSPSTCVYQRPCRARRKVAPRREASMSPSTRTNPESYFLMAMARC